MFTWEIMSSLFKNPNYVLFKNPVVIMKEIMSWLFKNLINSGLTQFDHGQSNSKKWPNGWKDRIAPISHSARFLKKFSELIQN